MEEHLFPINDSSQQWKDYRNHIQSYASLTPIGLDAAALTALAKEMKRGGQLFSRYKIQSYRGVNYVIFEGYAGLREDLKGTRYQASNPKIVSMGIGKQGIKSVVSGGFVVSILISAGFHSVDQLLDDQRTWHDFVGGVAVDVAVAAVSSGIAWGAVGTYVGGATAMVAVGPLLAIVAVGTLATFFISRTIDTESLADIMANSLETLESSIKSEVEHSRRQIDRVERAYRSDPLSFLHRLFGIPEVGLRPTRS